MFDFSGKVVVITGATGGIGRKTASMFAEGGANLALLDIREDELRNLRDSLSTQKGRVLIYPLDVRDTEKSAEVITDVVKELRRVDVLINNAGVTRDKLFLRMSEEDWSFVLDINLKGTFNLSKACIPFMLKERKGCIINIASVVGITGNPAQTNYSASKAGVIAFSRSLAKEVGGRGIRVIAIAPGFVETPMTESLKEEVKREYLRRIPLGRFGKAEDVANLILFLASDYAGYITGQVFVIDGGLI